jgi:hypothetical protein
MTNRVEHRAALPVGYGLHEYRITGVLGHGGFGITYSANDAGLGKIVAIKEYLPGEFAVRDGVIEVAPKSPDDNEPFHWGLERFLEEARILARFHHPNLVSVHRYFEANGTAYMVMEFIEGDTLAQSFRNGMTFDAAALKTLALPLLDGLEAVHRAGYLHRDIKPSNIMLRPDGRPVLLDFGSARSALSRGTRAVTSLVTPGYAPYEQYYNDGNQGPWTDIYALGAILHQIVAGKAPVEAPARLKNDPLPAARTIGAGRYPESILTAIDWAMRFDETERPQTVSEWRKALTGDALPPPKLAAVAQDRIANDNIAKPKPRPRRYGALIAVVAGILMLGATVAYGVHEYRLMQQQAQEAQSARVQAQRDAEQAAEMHAAAVAREMEARQDAERARQASEEATQQVRQAEEKRKAEEKRRLEDANRAVAVAERAAAAAAERERQAEQTRRLQESEERTRKALTEAEARREAAAAEAAWRAREQARLEAEQRAYEERGRRGSIFGPIFGRSVPRDQVGRPRVLTGPINPDAPPPADMRMENSYPEPDRRRRRDRPYDGDSRLDLRDRNLRYAQTTETPPPPQYDAEAERRRAEERARQRAEQEQLRRDMEVRRERQRQDLLLLEERRLREKR